jgi:sphingolipid 4-desaturase/C4-monooxygenase
MLRSETPEPHMVRRRAIIAQHPEIKKLYGHDRGIIWTTFAVIAGQLAVTFAVVRVDRWWVTALTAYFVGSILNHWLAMSIHETSHNLATPNRLANKLLALLANGPCVFPMAMTFHRYHLDHHRKLGVENEDTDLPHPFEQRVIGTSAVKKFLWLFFYMLVYTARGLTFIKPPNKWEVVNLGTQAVMSTALYAAFGWHGLIYLMLSVFFGMSLHPVAAHFIHEHYTFAEGQETYSYYGPLNRVTFNVGYHVEHHDFMNVPGSRLPQLHSIAKEHYAPLVSHRSWTWVLWHFISSSMTLSSRIIRSRKAFESGGRRHARQAVSQAA